MKNNERTIVLILAGGKGKRLGLKTSKPLVKILGRPAIAYVLDSFKDYDLPSVIVANSANYEEIADSCSGSEILIQNDELRGTGGAVLSAINYICNYQYVLILQADDPLISPKDIRSLLAVDLGSDEVGVIQVADDASIKEVGRVKVENGRVAEIAENLASGLVNVGRYRLKTDLLLNCLNLTPEEANGEIYLTKALNRMLDCGFIRYSYTEQLFVNMNRQEELQVVREQIRSRTLQKLLANGVDIARPELVTIAPTVRIASGVEISGVTEIYGKSSVESGAIIHNSFIEDTSVGEDTRVESCFIKKSLIKNSACLTFSYIEGAIIKIGAMVGPYSHLRENAILGPRTKVGNFVEVKNSTLEEGVKANHLSYLGDATIGIKTNVGCGTITANYDGSKKHPTMIGRGCFIGCNSTLVAPVKIGDRSLIAAGSTITEDVPEGSLAIARERQQNKLGRAKKHLAEGKS